MATMDALMVETVGQPVVLRKRPIPEPGEGEIRIKVTVVGGPSHLHPACDVIQRTISFLIL